MPDFGVAVAWMVLAPVAVIINILTILIIQHYRPMYHSTDVALISLLFVATMASYFLIPIPAVLELGGWDWNHESCSFYTWLSTTLRFSHLLGLLVLNAYWVNALRAKARPGHMFMSSFFMKISILIVWFVSVVFGLAPVTGGTEIFGYYTTSSCHFLPSSISRGFGILVIIFGLSCVLMGIISSADTLMLFRNMKHIAFEKRKAGGMHGPVAGVSGIARSSKSMTHAPYSELRVATELCTLGLCLTLVSSLLNILPFVTMQFMLLFEDKHRGTFEDLTLWLLLVEALVLPHLMWVFSGRYRHAVVYAWKVYVMRDASAKEEDAAAACTLQSYKMRVNEQQRKATLNGVPKIEPPSLGRLGFDLYSRDTSNGNGGRTSTQMSTPLRLALSTFSSPNATNSGGTTSTFHPYAKPSSSAIVLVRPPTASATRRPSGNKICPIEQRSDSSVEGQSQIMLSDSSRTYSVTDLDDGLTVLTTFPQQTTTTENLDTVDNFNTSYSNQTIQLSNANTTDKECYPNDVYSRPLSKIKPRRKHMANSNISDPKIGFVDVSESLPGSNSQQIPASTVSSPTKSLLETPKREIDVKRTASACSRREWKEVMRKKHLPAIFVNNSIDDEKVVTTSSINNSEDTKDASHKIDSKTSPEIYELKPTAELLQTEIQNDTKAISDYKQQSFSEENFYVSGEFHYNFLSDSIPRKQSLKTQSTIDSDGVCDMYESDDIKTILDTSVLSDSISNNGTIPANVNAPEISQSEIIKDETEPHNESLNYTVVENISTDADTLYLRRRETEYDTDKKIRVVDTSEGNIPRNVTSSLEEFEENEKKIMMKESIDLDIEFERPASRLKLIDLESNTNSSKEGNGNLLDTNENMSTSLKIKNDIDDGKANKTTEMRAVLQDYEDLETVSGLELLQLKQHAITTVKTAHEITFDSSSEDGGIDNEGFEGDGNESRDADVIQHVKLSESQTFTNSSFGTTESFEDTNYNIINSEDMAERYVTGKEDSEESGSNQGNEQDNRLGDVNFVSDRKSILKHTETVIGENTDRNRKQEDFKTNPFLRESFEVLVQSPEYQEKIHSPDNPFFISVKPLALPRQKSLEISSMNSNTSTECFVADSKQNDANKNGNIGTKPPLPSRLPISTRGATTIKSKNTSDNTNNDAKPPVPIRKPYHLRKQNSLDKINIDKEREEKFNKPRTSSEEELKIFLGKKESISDGNDETTFQEDPSYQEEDPFSSTVTTEEDDSSSVFYFVEGETRKNPHDSSHTLQSSHSEKSIVIEPYGQRRPPWLDESLDSDQKEDSQSNPDSTFVSSQHFPSFNVGSNQFSKSNGLLEEYDLDSVNIRGVTETHSSSDHLSYNAKQNGGGGSIFYDLNDVDKGSSRITPVSEEEKPTFQFYQFDDDIERGFEDALSVDYVKHTNVYSGFGLCFESIIEEPEESFSESCSSIDGLGESNNSALFKTQAIVSRPSSRASVNSSPNVEAAFANGGYNAKVISDVDNANNIRTDFGKDQGYFNFGEMDTVNYENFASIGNEPFITSERTSGDGREETIVHSNGGSSALHSHPPFGQSFSQNGFENSDESFKGSLEPSNIGMISNNDTHNISVSQSSQKVSPWLRVKTVDLDMSFESDFSQQTEGNLTENGGTGDNNETDISMRNKKSDINVEPSNSTGYFESDEQFSSDPWKANKSELENKPNTQTIHYKPVYF